MCIILHLASFTFIVQLTNFMSFKKHCVICHKLLLTNLNNVANFASVFTPSSSSYIYKYRKPHKNLYKVLGYPASMHILFLQTA